MLVDAGADVVKVEPASGKPDARRHRHRWRPRGRYGFPAVQLSQCRKAKCHRTFRRTADPGRRGRGYRKPVAQRHRSGAAARRSTAMRCRHHVRFRLDRPVGRTRRVRVHVAGVVGVHRVSRRSRRPADLDRRRAGGVHGRCVRRVRCVGDAPSGTPRRTRRAPGLVDARSDDTDAELRMAARAAAEAFRRSGARSRCRRSNPPRTATSASRW